MYIFDPCSAIVTRGCCHFYYFLSSFPLPSSGLCGEIWSSVVYVLHKVLTVIVLLRFVQEIEKDMRR